MIKDKGEQFQQEVADRLLEVRQGFAPEDVKSCRMSAHGEDIILSPEARQVLPITVECKAQKRHAAHTTCKQAHCQAKELCLLEQPEPVLCIKVASEVPLAVMWLMAKRSQINPRHSADTGRCSPLENGQRH